MADHANAKTTGLYDLRNDDISVGEVERIGILNGCAAGVPSFCREFSPVDSAQPHINIGVDFSTIDKMGTFVES
jgi:hypothetical protein